MSDRLRRGKARRGSELSTRQLAFSVKEGRKVTITGGNGISATGYVCGMDDYHFMVVRPDNTKALVHKAGAFIDLHSESTYEDEPNHKSLEQIVGPYRRCVLTEIFGQPVLEEDASPPASDRILV